MHTGYVIVTLCLTFAPSAYAGFHLADKYVGRDFFDGFNWETMDDPTHGRVNFVDQATALNSNLSYASDNKFVMCADSTKVVSPNDRGRDSIRITSHKAYDDSVIVLDIAHVPEGCSTWPAFWTFSQSGPWPNGGEIDILEGANLQTGNIATLHTTGGCSMPKTRFQSGHAVSTNCDVAANSNQGCSTQFTAPNSYGSPFNDVGCGWYVMKKTASGGVNIWFWSRGDLTVPHDVHDAGGKIEPNDSWGMPDATFPVSPTCDYASHFNAHQIIFDLSLCGELAGSKFSSSGCGPGSCTDFVDKNPASFAKAYWEINSLRIYTSA